LGLSYIFNKIMRKKEFTDMEIILCSWALSSFFLLYAPINIQRRFIEGLNIPIMILGSLGFYRVMLPPLEKLAGKMKIGKSTAKAVSIAAIVILICPTSIYWLYRVGTSASSNDNYNISEYSVPLYLSRDEISAMEWLRDNTRKEDIVISGYGSGNYIPRISGNRVFLGHWAQTINYEAKKRSVEEFFSTTDEIFQKSLIADFKIMYVYYGPEEKALGIFNPGFLAIAYENSEVRIYRVL
jgi:uncharacterized membrane protein